MNRRADDIETAAIANAAGIPSLMSIMLDTCRMIGRNFKRQVRVKTKPSQAEGLKANHVQVCNWTNSRLDE